MKKDLNYTIYFILAAVVILKLPNITSNFKLEGKQVTMSFINEVTPSTVESDLKALNGFIYPVKGKKSIAIFWASWCTPCSLELKRINSAIEKNEIPKDQIFAISIDSDFNALKKAIIDRQYLFKTYFDRSGNLSRNLNVQATPTIAFIDGEQKIKWITTGVSPTLIEKIKSFLKD
jgi:cytochrome c biogenesis protein CcmG/thiol:disulfide interchange protein DsbE